MDSDGFKLRAAPGPLAADRTSPAAWRLLHVAVPPIILRALRRPSVVNIANIALARPYYSTDVLKIPQGGCWVAGHRCLWCGLGQLAWNSPMLLRRR